MEGEASIRELILSLEEVKRTEGTVKRGGSERKASL